jgi:hypothetical protein
MIAALRAAETKTERSGGAGRKGGVGEMNARPALASCPVANAERSASGVAAAKFRANEIGAPPYFVKFAIIRSACFIQ